MLFKHLSPEEEARFRQWTRDNYGSGQEVPEDSVRDLWHPVVNDELVKIQAEKMSPDIGALFVALAPAMGWDIEEVLREALKNLNEQGWFLVKGKDVK